MLQVVGVKSRFLYTDNYKYHHVVLSSSATKLYCYIVYRPDDIWSIVTERNVGSKTFTCV